MRQELLWISGRHQASLVLSEMGNHPSFADPRRQLLWAFQPLQRDQKSDFMHIGKKTRLKISKLLHK